MQISKSAESQLTKCIFVGPSLENTELDRAIVRFGPAQLGSIYLAAKSGYKIIGLVDGIFGNVPAVWHKEILYALDHGCVVWGSSSIGALRAAELYAYGMRGVGLCYRLYRAGIVTDDDEVAVIHGDSSVNYMPFSEPLVNARLTLRKLRRNGSLSPVQEVEAVTRFKALHFSQRTFTEYKRNMLLAFGTHEGNRIYALFRSQYRNVKREDALQLANYLLSSPSASSNTGFFLRTGNWRRQFEELESELKSLNSEVHGTSAQQSPIPERARHHSAV
jgi:hypothetical protein